MSLFRPLRCYLLRQTQFCKPRILAPSLLLETFRFFRLCTRIYLWMFFFLIVV
ncbi:unnamed protein product [Brassica oleracea var. botrytis]